MNEPEVTLRSFIDNYLNSLNDRNAAIPFYQDHIFFPYICTEYPLVNTRIEIYYYPLLQYFKLEKFVNEEEVICEKVYIEEYENFSDAEKVLRDLYEGQMVTEEKEISDVADQIIDENTVNNPEVATWYNSLSNDQRYDLRIDSSHIGSYADLDDEQKSYLEGLYNQYKQNNTAKRGMYAANGEKVDRDIWYQADYYDKQGGHGALQGSSSNFDREYKKALELYKREKKAGELGKSTGYIGVNGSGDKFAIVYIDQDYFSNLLPRDFKDKASYDNFLAVASDVLNHGVPKTGTYHNTAAKGAEVKKITYPTERLHVDEQSIEERELELYIDNDGDLYRQRVVPIQTNLVTKIARGNFDINLAPKIYKYLIDDGIKKYNKDFGGMELTKAQKENLAKEYVNRFLEEASLGNYENYLPKKYQYSKGGYLIGRSHAEGGIEVIAPNGPIEVEGGEVIINKMAVSENCELLSLINQSAGDGVAFDCGCDHEDEGNVIPMAGKGKKVLDKNGSEIGKGDRVRTREGKIETVAKINSNGNIETEENNYSWPPYTLIKISDNISDSPYYVYDLLSQNIVDYFENEIEAEDFADTNSDYEVRLNDDYIAKKGKIVKDKKWFGEAVNKKAPFDLGGWHKDLSAEARRKLALESRDQRTSLHDQYLSASRALQALANVTKDKETKDTAYADAEYFRKQAGKTMAAKGSKVSKKYPDKFEEVLDLSSEQYYIRDFEYVETEGKGHIDLAAVATIRDLREYVSKDELPKEGNFVLDVTLVPYGKFVSKKLKDSANDEDSVAISDNDEVNLVNYMGGLNYNPEGKYVFKTQEEAEKYVLSKEFNDKITADAIMSGYILDRKYNRIGQTNWDYLAYMVGTTDKFAGGGYMPKYKKGAKINIKKKKSAKGVKRDRQTKRGLYNDSKFKAEHAGKRTSADGNTYYEYRANRSDKDRRIKLAQGGKITDERINEALNGYLSAVLFTSSDESDSDEFLDKNYSVDDFDKDTVKKAKSGIEQYYKKHIKAINESGLTDDQIGIDMWFAQSHQGAGFFDRDLDDDIEKELTQGALAFNENRNGLISSNKKVIIE